MAFFKLKELEAHESRDMDERFRTLSFILYALINGELSHEARVKMIKEARESKLIDDEFALELAIQFGSDFYKGTGK